MPTLNYLFLLSRKFLFKRKGSTLLASMGIAATIFIIMFNSIVFGGALNGVVKDLSDLRFGHIQITNDKGEITNPDYQIISTLAQNPMVLASAPRLTTVSDINFTSLSGVTSRYRVEVVGIDPPLERVASSVFETIIAGSTDVNQHGIILGQNVVEDLGVHIGDFVTIKVVNVFGKPVAKRLMVTGISEHEGFAGFDNSAIIHIREMRKIRSIETRPSTSIIVRLHDEAQAEQVKDWIQARFPKLTVRTIAESGEEVVEGFRQGVEFINLVGYAGTVATAFGIITVLTMMVAGKTRDIGVLRALGIQKRNILLIFILDGAIIGIIGATCGAVLGTATALYFQTTRVALFGGLALHVVFTPEMLYFPVIAGFLIAVLASIYPAWKASTYEPAEAMRYF
ncbi:MAG: ABC transporter permease [Thaumarchaeota archaeon]|nr:ABC transporter permease [Nitrososphaerota archaeon]